MALTKYVWDPLNDSYLMELDGAGSTTAVYTQESADFGGLVSQRRGTVTSFFHFDIVGSTRCLSDSSQSLTDIFTFDVWGNQVARTGTVDAAFQWVGRFGYYVHDGYIYIRARSYRPALGAWLSVDPILMVSVPGSRLGISPYAYADNSPSRIVDPTGLFGVGKVGDEAGGDETQIRFKCDHWQVSEWNTDLCNWGDHKTSDGTCQHCKCSDSAFGHSPRQDYEIQELFDKAVQEVINKNGFGSKCDVRFVVRDTCSGPFAVTCPGVNDSGPHTICIPRYLDRCGAFGLNKHEMQHALQLCQGRREGRPKPGSSGGAVYTCAELERDAYAINCKSENEQECIVPAEQKEAIQKCIRNGVKNSCDGENKGGFNTLCDEIRNQANEAPNDPRMGTM